jgi:CHAT domain-containing protein
MPLRQLAYTRADRDELGAAVALLARAAAIEEAQYSRALAQGSEEQKDDWAGLIAGRGAATLAFHARYGAADPRATRLALTTLLRARGRVLDAVTDLVGRLRRRGGAPDMALLQRWTRLLAEESGWYVNLLSQAPPTRRPTARDPDFDRIRVAREDVEREIARRIGDVPADTGSLVDVAQVQATLPKDCVLLEFSEVASMDFRSFGDLFERPGERSYGVFLLAPAGEPTWVRLGEAGTIDAAVDVLCAAWGRGAAEWRGAARRVDELLIEPLRSSLEGAGHVLIVPTGTLCRVPFAALVDQHGRYEIERYTFTYLTTGRDLVRPMTTRADRSPPLIVAGPDFEQGNAEPEQSLARVRGRGPGPFPPLPGAVEEGQMLVARIPGSVLRTGASASKLSIANVRGPSILHVASHGFYQPDTRDRFERLFDEFPGAALPSPLLRSGIALAGANRYGDGLLTALEICGLDLGGTELVTLSACETGLGDVSSFEGVYGFRRSFFLAGAESLLVSLFPVPDDATQRVMKAFYERLLSGATRAGALRDAQLAVLGYREAVPPTGDEQSEALRDVYASAARANEERHPQDWAGFILMGDWGPLVLQRVGAAAESST